MLLDNEEDELTPIFFKNRKRSFEELFLCSLENALMKDFFSSLIDALLFIIEATARGRAG
jgi:hypothetical protein